MNDLAALERAQALAANERGEFEQSIPHWRAVIEKLPTDATAHHNLGVALEGAYRLQEAQLAYHEAARLDPRLAEAQYGLGLLCRNERRWVQMMTYCRRAAALRPGWRTALFGTMFAAAERAKETRRAADWQAALEAVNHALATRPDQIGWRHERAHCLWRLGQKRAAVRELEALVATDPTPGRYAYLTRYQFGTGCWRGLWRTLRAQWKWALKHVDWEREGRKA